MKTATSVVLVALLAVSVGSAQNPWGDWVPQPIPQTTSNLKYQQRAGSTTTHRNGAVSESWFNSGFTQEAGVEIGVSSGNDKQHGTKFGRERDEKWFAGVRGGVRAGYAADTGVAQTGQIGNTRVRSYAEAEAFVGVEAGAQAGVSNNGVGVNANAFAGARVGARTGTEVGPVDAAVTGEAWAGVGVEAGADAKYKNGRIKFDYGAGGAIGVGGKFGGDVSVDVRQPIKAAKGLDSTRRSVSNDVGKTARTVSGSTRKSVKSVKSTGKKAKRSIGKLFK
ncbi:hypothetical protein [Planctomycetes bacterium TBK1r]|uniref:Uncharacterized protein n=1 Tax=Stieleria magnilauensis TaxID=2527963 RepID=A0ABX5XNE7_9BACT|nr:hypothetical protein TBK1r_23740 [Planctomycetes bacterium TBK1r]